MKIENKEQFNEYVDTLNKRGAKFDFDCCEVILLNDEMLMRDKSTANHFLWTQEREIVFGFITKKYTKIMCF